MMPTSLKFNPAPQPPLKPAPATARLINAAMGVTSHGIAAVAFCLGITTSAFASNNEPPHNPFLADSAWPMTHRNPYVQASSPLPGPTSASALGAPRYTAGGFINITQAMSAPYSDGSIVAWGSSMSNVYKTLVSPTKLSRVDRVKKPDAVNLANATTGAYTLLDKDNTFFVPAAGKLYAYTDSESGNAHSKIQLARTFTLPTTILHDTPQQDPIVGINMTWDGYLALATKRGTVMVVKRDFSEYHFLQLSSGNGEEISNSIAVDERGGIYVVSSQAMYRVQWTGTELSTDNATGAWRSSYENGANVQVPGRLGAGSGSTPTLMGVGDQDKFVVITDGQQVTHLVLFWRDEIPADWQPIAPGKDRRIAAEIPVDYGNPAIARSVSEQSVLVSGYGAVVVNNDYGVTQQSSQPLMANFLNGLVVLLSNTPRYAPYGVEKFAWNPVTRKVDVAWVNTSISCPNGIPTMSTATQMFYCVGQRKGVWNIEGLDWNTGASVFYKPLSTLPIHNSFYASTQIGPWGDIWSGTTTGVMQIAPKF